MRRTSWTPGVSFGTCLLAMLAVGMRAQASCPPPGPLDEAGTPGVQGWAGPPSVDGSLDDGALPGYGDGGENIIGFLGLPPPSTPYPTPFAYTTVTAPYTDTASCMAYNAQGHTAAHNCLCQNCFSLMQQCDSLPNCQAEWKCGADSGCAGMANSSSSTCTLIDTIYPALGCTAVTTCYFAPGAPCEATIDQVGNAGVPTALNTQLLACGNTNNCPTM